MKVWAGGCALAVIRYEARGRPVGSGARFCRSCQYASGGGPVYAMLRARSDIRSLKDVPRISGHEHVGDLGAAVALCRSGAPQRRGQRLVSRASGNVRPAQGETQ